MGLVHKAVSERVRQPISYPLPGGVIRQRYRITYFFSPTLLVSGMQRRRIVWIVGGIIVALLVVWGISRLVSPSQATTSGNRVKVQRGSIAAFVTATGRVATDKRARISVPFGGTLATIAEVGQSVATSAPLATVNSIEARAQLQDAQTALLVAQAQRDKALAGAPTGAIEAAQAQLTAAQLALSVAENRLDDVPPEAQDNSNEAVDVERARAAMAGAEATLRQAIEGVSAADVTGLDAQVTQAQTRVEVAQQAVAALTVTAPFAAVIVERLATAGERVAQGQQVLTIADLGSLYVAAEVDEVDVGRVAVGQAVTVTIDAFPIHPLTGKVTAIAFASTPGRGAITYIAKIAVDPGDLVLRLDMSAEAQIRTNDESEILLLPQNTIRYAENQPYVLVERGGQSVQQIVTLGAADDRNVEILSGLAEGESVIVP